MPTCPEIEPLITAFVDQEASAAERAAVSAHLGECAACRRRANEEGIARRVLHERADVFRLEAPASLRARCQPPPRRAPLFRAFIRPLPAWAAALLVVVLVGAAFYGAGRVPTVFAAELALDHLKCFALFDKSSGPGDPAAVAERMKAAYGWAIVVPGPSAALGLSLVGGRRCFSTDGRVAHIMYRHADHPLSLFVVPGTSRAAQQLAVLGHRAIIWSRHGNTFVVLAREPRDDIDQVAAYVRSVVH